MQNLIKAINYYISLSDQDIYLVGQLFVKKDLKVNDCLLKAGEVCKEFVFIDKGLLRHCINNDGKEETFYFSAEGDFVCDYESFINKAISKKSIIAMEETTIFSISYSNMQLLYSKVTLGERFGRLFVEETFTKAIKHIISTHTDTAEQRYLNFMCSFRHIQQRIPQYYIASFVGVTPQSLSRIRRKLVKK
jgi:CRP-like cAMP-binding protein